MRTRGGGERRKIQKTNDKNEMKRNRKNHKTDKKNLAIKGDTHRISVDGINKKVEALVLEALNKSSAPGVIIECAQFGGKRRKKKFWSINEEK